MPNKKREFLISILNRSEEKKKVNFHNLIFEKFERNDKIISVNNVKSQNLFTRQKGIKDQLRSEHLNWEEKDAIISLCIRYSEIFYLDGDKLTSTNEIKHSIDTNNSKPIYSKA